MGASVPFTEVGLIDKKNMEDSKLKIVLGLAIFMAAFAMIHADPEPRYGYRGRYGQSRGGYGGVSRYFGRTRGYGAGKYQQPYGYRNTQPLVHPKTVPAVAPLPLKDTARSSLLPLPKSGAGPAVTVAGKFPVVRNSPAARTATAARRTPAARRAPVARPAPVAPAAPVSRPAPVSRLAPVSRPAPAPRPAPVAPAAPVAPVAPAAPIVPAPTQAPDFGPDLRRLAPRQEPIYITQTICCPSFEAVPRIVEVADVPQELPILLANNLQAFPAVPGQPVSPVA